MPTTLLMRDNPWKRQFLRPDGALQEATAWRDNGDEIVIQLQLPEQHYVMPLGWQKAAKAAAERKIDAGEMLSRDHVMLKLSDLEI